MEMKENDKNEEEDEGGGRAMTHLRIPSQYLPN